MCCTSKVIGPKRPKAHNIIYINRTEHSQERKNVPAQWKMGFGLEILWKVLFWTVLVSLFFRAKAKQWRRRTQWLLLLSFSLCFLGLICFWLWLWIWKNRFWFFVFEWCKCASATLSLVKSLSGLRCKLWSLLKNEKVIRKWTKVTCPSQYFSNFME